MSTTSGSTIFTLLIKLEIVIAAIGVGQSGFEMKLVCLIFFLCDDLFGAAKTCLKGTLSFTLFESEDCTSFLLVSLVGVLAGHVFLLVSCYFPFSLSIANNSKHIGKFFFFYISTEDPFSNLVGWSFGTSTSRTFCCSRMKEMRTEKPWD